MAKDLPTAAATTSRAARLVASAHTTTVAALEATSRLRVLVVDDLADAADSLAVLLRILGHEARTAYDGSSALELARDFQPHAVFLDIAMPGLDGYSVAMRLRQLMLQKVCLIALSGYGRKSDIQKAKTAGFDRHLLKPASSDQISAILAEVAARYGSD